MKISDNAKEWIKELAIAILVGAVVLFFIMPTVVKEHSMENTLHENDYVFVSRQHYRIFGKSPQRGDVIVFRSSLQQNNGRNKLLVKRVVGVAGDSVAITNGELIINGEVVTEDYTKDGYTLGSMDEITVPEGRVFVLGDNRQDSADSRDNRIGCVDIKDISGKVIIRLFPFNNISIID